MSLGLLVAAWETALRLFLVVMAAQLLRLGLTPLRRPPAPPEPPRWPKVTVQLPVRDEGELARRVLGVAAALDYPRDRLDVQVLDDSSPGGPSARIVDDAAASARASGLAVSVLRRPDRAGGKAGNLQHGLDRAAGELVLVLDADTRAAPGLLRGLVAALLADPRAVMAQGAQRFDGADDGWLQRAQAILVEGLTQVEQPIRSASGQPLHFNGTGGIWRADVIRALGGWRGVCEDYDLSLRAQVAGHRLLHRVDLTVHSELTARVSDLRRQQRRWTAGKAAAVRRVVGELPGARSRALELVAPLVGRLLHPLVAGLALAAPAVAWGALDVPGPPRAWDLALLGVVEASAALHLRRVGRGRLAGDLALASAMLVGVSFACARGLVEGWIGREPAFERTPKAGARGRGDPSGWVETLVGALCVTSAPAAAARGDLGSAASVIAIGAPLLAFGLGSRWWDRGARVDDSGAGA